MKRRILEVKTLRVDTKKVMYNPGNVKRRAVDKKQGIYKQITCFSQVFLSLASLVYAL
jgi:hypothetical protein